MHENTSVRVRFLVNLMFRGNVMRLYLEGRGRAYIRDDNWVTYLEGVYSGLTYGGVLTRSYCIMNSKVKAEINDVAVSKSL